MQSTNLGEEFARRETPPPPQLYKQFEIVVDDIIGEEFWHTTPLPKISEITQFSIRGEEFSQVIPKSLPFVIVTPERIEVLSSPAINWNPNRPPVKLKSQSIIHESGSPLAEYTVMDFPKNEISRLSGPMYRGSTRQTESPGEAAVTAALMSGASPDPSALTMMTEPDDVFTKRRRNKEIKEKFIVRIACAPLTSTSYATGEKRLNLVFQSSTVPFLQ